MKTDNDVRKQDETVREKGSRREGFGICGIKYSRQVHQARYSVRLSSGKQSGGNIDEYI